MSCQGRMSKIRKTQKSDIYVLLALNMGRTQDFLFSKKESISDIVFTDKKNSKMELESKRFLKFLNRQALMLMTLKAYKLAIIY